MKRIIFAFILGGILIGSITGVVAYNYNAKNISYTPSDNSWNVSDVESALKDLRSNSGSISKNMTIEEVQSYSVSPAPSSFTIENVTNYRYYYVTSVAWHSSSTLYSDSSNDAVIASITNGSYLKLGTSRGRYKSSQSGNGSGFIIFPDGSGNNIEISISAGDALSIYGIK